MFQPSLEALENRLTPSTVTGVSPNSGPQAGGTSVAITGTGFTQVYDVDFGTTSASSYTVNSATSITATSPAGTGTVDVTVLFDGPSTATSPADQFTYLAATPPTVTSVSPSGGPLAGGTSITIAGTGFTGATSVHFGSTAVSFTFNSDSSITVIAPAGTGVVDVTVTTGGGTSATSSADHFTYTNGPTISSVSPSSGPTAGGTMITITGTQFNSGASVTIGGVVATNIIWNSATSITVTTPAGTVGGANVVVINPDTTTATDTNGFTYLGGTGNQIQGTVFVDLNADGVLENGKPGLAGQTVYLDLNNNGIVDSNEPTAVTDVNGNYLFTNLAAGTYTVRQANLTNQVATTVTHQGYTDFHGTIQTGPVAGSYSVTLSGSPVASLNFGDVPIAEASPAVVRPDIYPTMSPNTVTAYVDGLYHSILNRDSDAAGLASRTGQLGAKPTLATRLQITLAMWNSVEHRGLEVDNYYETFLGRTASPIDRAYWIQQFQTGATEEQIVVGFVTSAEYTADHGSNAAFIGALYTDLVARNGDAAGIASWESQLNAGVSRMTLASHFLATKESLLRTVDSYYLAYEHRLGDGAGAANWLANLQSHQLTMGSLAGSFLASNEYYANAAL